MNSTVEPNNIHKQSDPVICPDDLIEPQIETDWNQGLRVICQSGNLNITQMMINYGANDLNYCDI
jgi:hypothetical protein